MPADNEGLLNVEGVDFNLGLSTPIDALAKTFVGAWSEARANMSQENRNEWDKRMLRLYDMTVGKALDAIAGLEPPKP